MYQLMIFQNSNWN